MVAFLSSATTNMTSTEREVAFRKRRHDYAIHKPKNAIRAGTEVIRVKQDRFLRPETLLARSRKTRADKRRFQINSKRKESANFPQPPEDVKSALVIRVAPKGDNLCPEAMEILKEFKLEEQFDGCFVQLSEENRQKLKSVAHLITYGNPVPETVRQLILTKAQTAKDGVEVLITSNKTVSDALGELGIEGLTDIVYAINKGTDTISAITKFLAPFHFSKSEIKDPKQPVHAGGASGWRGESITEFVEQIL